MDDNPDELEELLRTIVNPIRRYLLRRTDPATAEDVLAEALATVWRRRAEVPANPVAWSIGIARLQLANARRGQRRRDLLEARLAQSQRVSQTSTESSGEQDLVQQILGELRPADAELLMLWAWDELPVTDLAVILGITPNAVSVRLHRARQKFLTRYRKISPSAGHRSSEGGEEWR